MNEILDQYGLDREYAVEILREIEYDYIQIKLSESIEEGANVHPKLPDRLHCLHSIINIIDIEN